MDGMMGMYALPQQQQQRTQHTKHSGTTISYPVHLTLYRDSTHLNLSVLLGVMTLETLMSIALVVVYEMSDSENEVVDVCFALPQIKNGHSPELYDLTPGRVINGIYPGDRTRAMGHALYLVEQLDDVGIAADREYVGEVDDKHVEEAHRIDVVIQGVNE